MSPEQPPASTLVGTVLDGSYRIEGLLGEGGMGAVYTATHLRLDRRVAVKVMARELAANTEALARFHREARVTSGLGHPHIVQVFDFSTTPAGEPFLVMELLEGEDLEHRLRRVRRLPLAEVAPIVKQVASALAAAHGKAIVHRDLKPANLFLLAMADGTDFVKVLDFGISKVVTASTKLTRAAAIVGTPNYMSPEQASGNIDDIDNRTDGWALACIAWECLTGEMLFAGDNPLAVLHKIVYEPLPALATRVAGLGTQVENVLVRALAKDKRDRFASVNEFAAALDAAVCGNASADMLVGQRTMQLPSPAAPPSPSPLQARTTIDEPTPDSAPALSTFTRTAGEMTATAPSGARSRTWLWAVAIAGPAILLLVGLLLLRPRAAPATVTSRPARSPVANTAPSPPPAAFLPKPAPEIPAPTALPAMQPSAPDEVAKPTAVSKPKKIRHAPARLDEAAAAGSPVQPPQADQPSSKESQDKWRLD